MAHLAELLPYLRELVALLLPGRLLLPCPVRLLGQRLSQPVALCAQPTQPRHDSLFLSMQLVLFPRQLFQLLPHGLGVKSAALLGKLPVLALGVLRGARALLGVLLGLLMPLLGAGELGGSGLRLLLPCRRALDGGKLRSQFVPQLLLGCDLGPKGGRGVLADTPHGELAQRILPGEAHALRRELLPLVLLLPECPSRQELCPQLHATRTRAEGPFAGHGRHHL
mmetsp:Transcript_70386/g.228827  ORF Transcript_70386/g.228827 Transcript_70386/m.228827 type:complete len:224 (-) Transcript_70386:547-1218(-)